MTDIIGTAGLGGLRAAAKLTEDDILLILRDPNGFVARLSELGNLVAAGKSTLSDLGLASDLQEALTQARSNVDATGSAKDTALRALDEARRNAAIVLSEAEASAKKVVDDATKAASVVSAGAAKARRDADAYAERVKAEVDAALEQAREMHRLAAVKSDQANKVQQQADALHQQAAAGIAAAEKMRSDLLAKAARLQKVTAELAGA